MKAMIVAVASGFIAGSITNTANAEPSRNGDPMVTEWISYADLNLNSISGQNRLKNRISYAAYRLCLVDSAATPSPAIADPVCFRKAMSDGLEQMDRAIAATNKHSTLASASLRMRR